MARITYDNADAAAFEATRHLTDDGLSAWREAVTRHLDPHAGMRTLDLGSGTGMWAQAFTDGRVLIRSAFAGRHQAITLFRYFPEAIRVLDTYPSAADVEAAFTAAGFTTVGFEQVPQVSAPSLREAATALRREAHTPLQLINDDEYAAGLARLHRAARTETGPVVDALDLLVLA
ncbi:SAM-dependent methyltransferase [Micromonospora chokoriensis]